jgi:predicted dehydrogenase
MSEPVNRRYFLGAAAAGAALGLSSATAAQDANSRITVGILGTGGRGAGLARTFQQQPNCDVTYVCDVDQARAGEAAEGIRRVSNRKPPRVVGDVRRVLDDGNVDVLVICAPNHWHAPAAILGCAAGKHVYVEKPCSHNPREGELLLQAARRYNRKVQMGNQRRSHPQIQEAIERLKTGVIGRAYYAQCFYLNLRPETGRCVEEPVPAGFDYELWQGPAPRRPYRTNIIPYKWHWFWHWGNGELGNNGVHYIDVCRWGLDVGLPTRVASTGGRYRYDDDQETPDTNNVTYDFPGRKSICWEGMSCNRMPDTKGAEMIFHGSDGSLAIEGSGYAIYEPSGRLWQRVPGQGNDGMHLRNFLNAVRGQGQLNSEIEEAAKSTLLCHLGNIAYRQSKVLTCDPANGRIQNDPAAMQLWTREYAPGWWEPRV